MPVHQPGQGDEVATGQRQQRNVWGQFLEYQANASDQEHAKVFHHLPRHLTVAWAIYA
jgi:hypothetical protein